jgi:pyruvate formate lyase activating enzyme
MKEAAYYSVVAPPERKTLRCVLCPHHCLLADGKTGICLARKNTDGVLYSLVYLRPVSAAVDPIEKKPLYHFHPGARIFSTGPNGCTFKCRFCQNCEISQEVLNVREVPRAAFVKSILDSGTIGIAYTYSEPFVWFETIMEIGAEMRARGLANVMVTNGFMEPEPLADLLTLVDAMNIDIKSMNPSFYRRVCKGRLEPVLAACATVKKKCHLEITNLVIPGENDSEEDIRRLSDWIAANLGRDTPLHFSRYFPRYQMHAPPTPKATLLRAYEIARDKLDYVYLGNADASVGSDTVCPSCKTMLIQRDGYSISLNESLKKDSTSSKVSCPSCHRELNIILP